MSDPALITASDTLPDDSLLRSLVREFIGLDTEYPRLDGRRSRRHYLDSAATTLMLRPAFEAGRALLDHYASTHSESYAAACIATQCYRRAHERVLRFLRADPERYACVFTGSGATGAVNRLAESLARRRPQRPVVLLSTMEHHSNDLPHRRHAGRVEHIRSCGSGAQSGGIDLEDLDRALAVHGESVNYVAVTAASNVTGVLTPLRDIAARAHSVGALVIVDASQFVAHAPLSMQLGDGVGIDALVFSGHKAYAPGAPGVLVADTALLRDLQPLDLGGGMVDDVFLNDFLVTERIPEREEAGTPNITGAVMLASALDVLDRIGMQTVRRHEAGMLAAFWEKLSGLDGLRLYGPPPDARHPRLGSFAFNARDLDHGLLAAALGDYFNVEVRNGCFCAHPYVRELLRPELWALDIDPDAPGTEQAVMRKRGMVRASLGLYSTPDDLEALHAGLADILERPDYYRQHYIPDDHGNYRHRDRPDGGAGLFDAEQALDQYLRGLSPESAPG